MKRNRTSHKEAMMQLVRILNLNKNKIGFKPKRKLRHFKVIEWEINPYIRRNL